jgi:hypothetical protein
MPPTRSDLPPVRQRLTREPLGVVEVRREQGAHGPEHGRQPAEVRMAGLLRQLAQRIEVVIDPGQVAALELREESPATSLGGDLAVTGALSQGENRRRQRAALLEVARLHQDDEPLGEHGAERGWVIDTLGHRDRFLAEPVASRVAGGVGQLARETSEQPRPQATGGGVEGGERVLEKRDGRAVDAADLGAQPGEAEGGAGEQRPRAPSFGAAREQRRVAERAACRLEGTCPLVRLAEIDQQLGTRGRVRWRPEREGLESALAQADGFLVGQPAHRLGRRAAGIQHRAIDIAAALGRLEEVVRQLGQ